MSDEINSLRGELHNLEARVITLESMVREIKETIETGSTSKVEIHDFFKPLARNKEEAPAGEKTAAP